jgi:hypothetical protein
MNAKKFEEIVKARAAKRVQDKIAKFKSELGSVFNRLTGESWYPTADFNSSPFAKRIFLVLASNDHSKGWPKELWEREEATVQAELFSIMDEMQKALIDAGRVVPEENKMEETL